MPRIYSKPNVGPSDNKAEVPEKEIKKPDKKNVMMFKYILESSGKKVTVRLERGADIDAACGQLRGKVLDKIN